MTMGNCGITIDEIAALVQVNGITLASVGTSNRQLAGYARTTSCTAHFPFSEQLLQSTSHIICIPNITSLRASAPASASLSINVYQLM